MRFGPAAVAAILLVTGAAACSGPAGSPADRTVQVGDISCGTGWDHPRAGEQTLYVHNTGNYPATVDLIAKRTGAVYAEVNGVAPNTTRSMPIDIGGGTYTFRCALEDSDDPMVYGPTITIPGRPAGPDVQPVTAGDLYGPDKVYTTYVAQGLTTLASDTDALKSDVDGGDLSGARSAWLTAHLQYERLGAAYDAFGDYDGEIDGNANGLPDGVHDSGFTGFYRVEYGLWHGESAASLKAPADKLDADVHGLVTAFPQIQVPILDIGLRTHEILENALQFQLTGEDDYGSGTTLATIGANIQGTQELLTVLHPILATRYAAGLGEVATWMGRLRTEVDAQDHNGTWTPVEDLGQSDHERLDGTLGRLLQDLAPIATICTPRKTFQ